MLAAVTDRDGKADVDPTSVQLTQPSHGSVSVDDNGVVTYVSNGDEVLADSFTYTVSDASGAVTNTATVTITITPVNDAPAVEAERYTVGRGETLVVAAPGLLANDTDAEGDSLTAELVDVPKYGSLIFREDGSFEYRADADHPGYDEFTYVVNDGTSDSVLVTVAIDAVSPPVGEVDSYTTAEDTPLTVDAPEGVLANDVDLDGDPLTATVVSNPENGTLTVNPDGSFTYTPDANFFGTDSFEYTASGGNQTSEITTVTITVTPVADTREVLTSVEPEGQVLGSTVADDGSIYVTSTTTTLSGVVTHITIIDPDDRDDPTVIDVAGKATYPAVAGPNGTAYVIVQPVPDGPSKLVVIDPSAPGGRTPVDIVGTPHQQLQVGSDGTAHVVSTTGDGRTTIMSVNASDPGHPSYVDFPGEPDGTVYGTLQVDVDGYMYLPTRTGNNWELVVVDSAGEYSIVDLPGVTSHPLVVGSDGTVYFSTYKGAFVTVFDRTDPGGATSVAVDADPFPPLGVATDGTGYQVLRGTGGYTVVIIDPDDPSADTTAFVAGDLPGPWTTGPDGVMYLVTSSFSNPSTGTVRVATFNPADPTNPTITELDGVMLRGEPGRTADGLVVTDDGTGYLTYQTPTEAFAVAVFDMADTDDPVNVALPGTPHGRLVVDRYGTAYQNVETDDDYQIAVIDPADPTHPTILDLPGEPVSSPTMGADGTAHVTVVTPEGETVVVVVGIPASEAGSLSV